MHKSCLQGANTLLGKKTKIQKAGTAEGRILSIRHWCPVQSKTKEFGEGRDYFQLEDAQIKLDGGASTGAGLCKTGMT